MIETSKKLYDLVDLLNFIPCSRAHLYNMAKSGDIPTVKVGKRIFVPAWFIEKMVNEPVVV